MVSEMVRSFELSLADIALERSFVRMCSDMDHQVVGFVGFVRAIVTLVHLFVPEKRIGDK